MTNDILESIKNYCKIKLGYQKAVSSFLIGKLHKAEPIFSQSHKTGTAFVTLGENRLGFVQFANR